MLACAKAPRRRSRRATATALFAVLAALAAPAGASAAVTLTKAPAMGSLSGVTLNGQAQTTATTWNLTTNPFTITTSGTTNRGWNLTVRGYATAGSAVFEQYCPNATCGTDSGPGYVAGGYTLPAGSLTINTAGAGWTTGTTKPTYQCNVTACAVDSATAVKIVSASTSVPFGSWQTSGSAALSLATPTTLHKLQAGEVYRVNLLWTTSTGP
jgi:hypothetical protein